MGKVKDYGGGARILGSILLIILCTVLIGSIIRIVFGGSSFTFSSFLAYLQDVPQISIGNLNIFYINGDWAVLDGLRKFLNSIMSIINFAVWMFSQLVNCLFYLFYFVKYLLVV